MAGGPGPDGPQPSARRECFKKCMSRVRSVSHKLNHPLQGSGSVQVLKRWKVASDYLLSRANNSRPLSLAVAAAYQMEMEEVRMYSMMKVYK